MGYLYTAALSQISTELFKIAEADVDFSRAKTQVINERKSAETALKDLADNLLFFQRKAAELGTLADLEQLQREVGLPPEYVAQQRSEIQKVAESIYDTQQMMEMYRGIIRDHPKQMQQLAQKEHDEIVRIKQQCGDRFKHFEESVKKLIEAAIMKNDPHERDFLMQQINAGGNDIPFLYQAIKDLRMDVLSSDADEQAKRYMLAMEKKMGRDPASEAPPVAPKPSAIASPPVAAPRTAATFARRFNGPT